jgi:hypothetical protein
MGRNRWGGRSRAGVAPDDGTERGPLRGRSHGAAAGPGRRKARPESHEGGRLVLRPFPAEVTNRLSQRVNGLCIAPWPRVYADLLPRGVRGQGAAEHLRKVMSDS